MRIVYALWLRQLKRYLRSRARVLGSLAQPLLFLFAIGFGFGPTYRKAGNGNFVQFLAPGIIAMAILFTAVFTGIEILWDRQFGFLKETLVAPVPRFLIVLGRTLGGATISLIQGFIIFAVCFLVGFRVQHWAWMPFAVLFMFFIAMLFTGIGTVIGSIIEDMQAFPLIMNFIVMPLFFFSGALFPLAGLPQGLHLLIRINPLTYGVDGLRGAFSTGFNFGFGTDLALSSLSALVFLCSGTTFSRRLRFDQVNFIVECCTNFIVYKHQRQRTLF